MGMPVRIDDKLYEQARIEALVEHRTIAGQIEYWDCWSCITRQPRFAGKFRGGSAGIDA